MPFSPLAVNVWMARDIIAAHSILLFTAHPLLSPQLPWFFCRPAVPPGHRFLSDQCRFPRRKDKPHETHNWSASKTNRTRREDRGSGSSMKPFDSGNMGESMQKWEHNKPRKRNSTPDEEWRFGCQTTLVLPPPPFVPTTFWRVQKISGQKMCPETNQDCNPQSCFSTKKSCL